MAYIGKTPVIGNFQKCDSIAVVNGQAAYTLQVGVPSDNTVSLAKLTATGTKDATTFLRGDNTFAEAGGGQWTHLLTQTANNSSSIDFSSTYITTTYVDYQIVMSGIKIATDSQYPRLLFSVDNGSNYLSDYRQIRIGSDDGGNDRTISQTSSSGIYMTNNNSVGNATTEVFDAIITVFDPLKQITTGVYTCATSHSAYHDDVSRVNISTNSHSNKVATAINNIRFDVSTSNITTGKVSLYGRKIS